MKERTRCWRRRRSQALPPEGLQITSAADLANKQADALNARISSDPAFKIWYAVKQNVQDKGDAFFNDQVKDFELPGDAAPSKTFSGTVVSVDPSKVTLGIEDPTKPDATLEFSQPLPAAAMDKIKVGEKIDFSGIADSYVKGSVHVDVQGPDHPGCANGHAGSQGKRKEALIRASRNRKGPGDSSPGPFSFGRTTFCSGPDLHRSSSRAISVIPRY